MSSDYYSDSIDFLFRQPFAAISLWVGIPIAVYVGFATIDHGTWVAGVAMVAAGVVVIVPGLWVQSWLDRRRKGRDFTNAHQAGSGRKS